MSEQQSGGVSRRRVLAAAGAGLLATLSGCATLVRTGTASCADRPVVVSGEPPDVVDDIEACHAGLGYYQLTIRLSEDAGAGAVDISHTDGWIDDKDREFTSGQREVGFSLNSQGPYLLRVITDSRAVEPFAARIGSNPDAGEDPFYGDLLEGGDDE